VVTCGDYGARGSARSLDARSCQCLQMHSTRARNRLTRAVSHACASQDYDWRGHTYTVMLQDMRLKYFVEEDELRKPEL
jgi:hypothetical protein